MSAVEIILRDSGKCLRVFIFTHVNVRKFLRDSGNPPYDEEKRYVLDATGHKFTAVSRRTT